MTSQVMERAAQRQVFSVEHLVIVGPAVLCAAATAPHWPPPHGSQSVPAHATAEKAKNTALGVTRQLAWLLLRVAYTAQGEEVQAESPVWSPCYRGIPPALAVQHPPAFCCNAGQPIPAGPVRRGSDLSGAQSQRQPGGGSQWTGHWGRRCSSSRNSDA
jgi:hypothetical protein